MRFGGLQVSAEPKRRGRPPKVAPEELREAGPNAAPQGSEAVEATQVAPAPVAAPVAPAVGLAGYVASLEGNRMHEGVVLVLVSHPDASGEVFPGKYSGVRTVTGPVWAMWSDGTKTDA
jgi:hypothetical protein